MAEEKTGGKWRNPGEAIIEVLIVVLLLGAAAALLNAIIQRILDFFGRFLGTGTGLSDFFSSILPLLWIISLILSLIFIIGIIRLSQKISQIMREMREPLYPAKVPGVVAGEKQEVPIENQKWNRIEEHINSEHPNDWKIAILEADIMLDEMLDTIGYRGVAMSDKLKQIERSDFLTIDAAWEAHKIRNQIAHEGGEFLITPREARRVVDLYRAVFEEFKYI